VIYLRVRAKSRPQWHFKHERAPTSFCLPTPVHNNAKFVLLSASFPECNGQPEFHPPSRQLTWESCHVKASSNNSIRFVWFGQLFFGTHRARSLRDPNVSVTASRTRLRERLGISTWSSSKVNRRSSRKKFSMFASTSSSSVEIDGRPLPYSSHYFSVHRFKFTVNCDWSFTLRHIEKRIAERISHRAYCCRQVWGGKRGRRASVFKMSLWSQFRTYVW